jgi:hypothetical protein
MAHEILQVDENGRNGAGGLTSSSGELRNLLVDDTTGRLLTDSSISGDINVDSTSIDSGSYIGKASGTNADFTTAYTAATQLTLSSLPSDITAFVADDIVTIVQVATSGAVTNTYTRDDATITMSGNVITVAGATFAATDTFVVYTNVAKPSGGLSYTSATQSDRVEEIDPLSSHYVGETLLDLTNIAQTTTAYAYLDMAGYRNFSLQGETSGTTPTDVLTVTVEATNQDDGTAQASCAYQDVTNALFGVASWVDTDFFAIADTPMTFKYVRVKYVTSTGGGNDCDLTVYAKRLY